ncbi:MAG: putative transcriptional regulator [Candidatus Bathyarchaeota archaeon B63]|nr:MAG: putative transcriptional regulator [Candidatus Bathyarchaeota archaeon B63]
MIETIHLRRGNILKQLRRRAIRTFMDLLILMKLRGGPMSGYDFITLIFREFGFLPSSGSIYSTLYALEREGLIEGYWNGKKRLYTLTAKGREAAQIASALSSSVGNLILSIFHENSS